MKIEICPIPNRKNALMKTAKRITFLWILLALFVMKNASAQQVDSIPDQAPSPPPSVESFLSPPIEESPLVVRASFHLQEINRIDDEAETVEFTGVLKLTWRDRRQAFDPREVGFVEKVYQGGYQFNELSPAWYPQVALANESGLFEKHATLLRVKPDGTSTLIETVNAIARVDLDLRRCPFDKQRLDLKFEVLGFDTGDVVLEAHTVSAQEDDQTIRLPQWVLTGLESGTRERDAPYIGESSMASTFVVSMKVERQWFFLVRLVVLPLMLIVILSWSVFWMDRSLLGDRINVSFIGILTAVAYQMVVSDILPRISYMTLINAILNFSFLVMCGTIMINLVVDGLDRRGLSEVGDAVDRQCRWIFPLAYCGLLFIAVVTFFFWF